MITQFWRHRKINGGPDDTVAIRKGSGFPNFSVMCGKLPFNTDAGLFSKRPRQDGMQTALPIVRKMQRNFNREIFLAYNHHRWQNLLPFPVFQFFKGSLDSLIE